FFTRRWLKAIFNGNTSPFVKYQVFGLLLLTPILPFMGILKLTDAYNYTFKNKEKYVEFCASEKELSDYEVITINNKTGGHHTIVELLNKDNGEKVSCYVYSDQIN
ncbi:hypothetical protein N9T72_01425, partial [bacterium]|nr:hypothetical protein [bacterium]